MVIFHSYVSLPEGTQIVEPFQTHVWKKTQEAGAVPKQSKQLSTLHGPMQGLSSCAHLARRSETLGALGFHWLMLVDPWRWPIASISNMIKPLVSRIDKHIKGLYGFIELAYLSVSYALSVCHQKMPRSSKIYVIVRTYPECIVWCFMVI